MFRTLCICAILVSLVSLTGCGKKKAPAGDPFDKLTPGMPASEVKTLLGEPKERGIAAWIKAVESGNSYQQSIPSGFPQKPGKGNEPLWFYKDKEGNITMLHFADGKLVAAEKQSIVVDVGKMLQNQQPPRKEDSFRP